MAFEWLLNGMAGANFPIPETSTNDWEQRGTARKYNVAGHQVYGVQSLVYQ